MTPQGVARLKTDEGFLPFPLRGPGGHLNIGYGTNLDAGISPAAASMLLYEKLAENAVRLEKEPWFAALDPARKDVIENMAYNMGLDGLFSFTNMIGALERGDYIAAAQQMRDSLWASQVGDRAKKLSDIMEKGVETA